MKKEKLLFRQVRLRCNENTEVVFSMSVCERDCYSIVCEDMEVRSALTRLFYGERTVAGGSISLNGKQERTETAIRYFQKKASVIGRRKKLIRALTLPENICLFSDVKKWNYARNFRKKSEELAELFGIRLNFSKPVEALTNIECVEAELLKAWAEKKELVVFSELSAFLNEQEQEELRRIVKMMREMEQPMTFLLIENPCEMVYNWSDRMQIMKDKMDLGSFKTDFLEPEKLYGFYSGRSQEMAQKDLESPPMCEEDRAGFEFQNVSAGCLDGISFHAEAGGFLNIFCLDAESRDGLRQCICGETMPDTGCMRLNGRTLRVTGMKSMRRQKICYCRSRAYDTMLLPDLTVRDNILLELTKKIDCPYIQKKYEKSVDYFIERVFGAGVPGLRVWKLPELERQRLVFLKIYMDAPRVLVCEQPFLGLDMRMAELTEKALKTLARRGMAIVQMTMNLKDLNRFEGDTLYLRAGRQVDEDEAYRVLYQK